MKALMIGLFFLVVSFGIYLGITKMPKIFSSVVAPSTPSLTKTDYDGQTITVGTRTFTGQSGYFTVKGYGNGTLEGCKIPYPTFPPLPNWTNPQSALEEYLAICAASLGDGCGYDSNEIAVRQQDMADFGVSILPASAMAGSAKPNAWTYVLDGVKIVAAVAMVA